MPEGEPSFEDRPYRPEDEPDVVALYGSVFGIRRTAGEVKRRLEGGPNGPARRVVLGTGDKAIGHVALVPLDAWVDGARVDVPLAVDAMIASSHQGHGGIGMLVSRLLHGYDAEFALALTTERPLRRFELLTKGRSGGRLPQWIRWHDVDRLAESAGVTVPNRLRPVVAAGLRVIARAAQVPSAGVRVRPGLPANEELDDLAAASRRFARVIHVRDAAYVRWRWVDDERPWRFHTARDRHGRLLGWVASGMDDRRSAGTGVIGDVLAAGPRALSALVRRAADDLVDDGATVVSVGYRDPRRWARTAVAMAGFLPRGVGPPILPFPLPGRGDAMPSIEGWYLTTGEII